MLAWSLSEFEIVTINLIQMTKERRSNTMVKVEPLDDYFLKEAFRGCWDPLVKNEGLDTVKQETFSLRGTFDQSLWNPVVKLERVDKKQRSNPLPKVESIKQETLDDYQLKEAFGEDSWNPLVKVERVKQEYSDDTFIKDSFREGIWNPVVKVERLDIKTAKFEVKHPTPSGSLPTSKVVQSRFEKILAHHGVTAQRTSKKTWTGGERWKAMEKICKDPTLKVSQQVGGRCEFRCPKCPKACVSWLEMRGHAKASGHDAASGLRTDGFVRFLAMTVVYNCGICSTRVLCERFFLGQHMKTHHGITLPKYITLLKSGLLSVRKDKAENQTQGKDGEEHQDECRTTAIGRDRTLSLRHQDVQKVLSKLFLKADICQDIGNKCRFLCPKCQRKFACWKTFSVHLRKTKHSTASLLHMEKFTTHVTVHKCKKCGLKVLCDMYFINVHLRIAHKTKVSDYSTNYGQHRFGCDFTDYKEKQKVCLEVLKCAPKSEKIGNMCVFSCNKCDSSFDNAKLYVNHLKKSGHGENSYAFSNLLLDQNTNTRIMSHQCKLCSDVLLCDRHFLLVHVTRKHKLKNLQEYSDTTGMELQPTTRVPPNKTWSHNIVDSIGNHCFYACDRCSFQSNTWSQLKCHLVNEHKLVKVFDKSAYLEKGASYVCDMCKKELLAEESVIRGHVNFAHKMSVGAYLEKTQGKVPRRAFERDLALFREFTRDIPQSKPRKLTVFEEGSEAEAIFTTKHCGNLCLFQCPKCPGSEYLSWNALSLHTKSTHQSVPKYHPKYVLEARYHKCHICNKIILSDGDFLCGHVQWHHKMSKSTYYIDNVLPSGAKVFSTSNRIKRQLQSAHDH